MLIIFLMYLILHSEALFQRCLFFFSQPVAGLTNQVLVWNSWAGAPLCFMIFQCSYWIFLLAGREDVKFPDFTLTKPLPRQLPTPWVHCNIAVFEIKTRSNPDEQDVEKSNTTVENAVMQAVGYARRLTNAFSLQEQNSPYIATYVVYGTYYMKVTFQNWGNALIPVVEPWQYVFEEFALAEGRAPFLYRLCELAVCHWNYNG